MNRLSDLSILVSSPRWRSTTCEGSSVCIGLSNLTATLLSKLCKFEDFERHIYLWQKEDMIFELLYLDGVFICRSGSHCTTNIKWAQIKDIYNEPILDACEGIYDAACRTGVTKSFWEAHSEQPDYLLIEEYYWEHVYTSAYVISTNHVVFKSMVLRSLSLTFKGGLTEAGPLVMYAILAPICLPRSPYHGCFFLYAFLVNA
jgi:hypothetical protein